MKKTILVLGLLLVMTSLSVKGQTFSVALPFMAVPIDAENAGKGNTYFGNAATATSGQQFAANLSFLYDAAAGEAGSVSMVSVNNRQFNGGTLNNFSFTHAKDDSRCTYALYAEYFAGGSIQGAYANGNDFRDVIIGGAFATPLDDRGYWSLGIGAKGGSSKSANTLVKENGYYQVDDFTLIGTDVSVAYNGKDVGSRNYVTAGAGITNMGYALASSGNTNKKLFLPTDLGIGLTYHHLYENAHQFALSLDAHYSLAPIQDLAQYQEVRYGLLSPSKILSINAGAEYKIAFRQNSPNSLAIRVGFMAGGNGQSTFAERYTGLTSGLGLRYHRFTFSESYFATPQAGSQYSLFGNSFLFGITYHISDSY